ncbi:hypothetical protein MW887_000928 [Aspergillus wentii]|nr:hypothetical protein MW887_000928 [Aspergillus wentii]
MASSERKLACLVCRHRKVACDRRRPQCGLCVKNNFDCQYKAREYRPGLRAGYVSELDKRLGQLERRMNALEGQALHEPSEHASHDSPLILPEVHRGTELPSTQPDMMVDAVYTMPTGSDELQSVWLQKYHPWFPIMHHTSIVSAFSEPSLVQKAITAVIIWDIPGLPLEQRQSQSEKLRQEAILAAMPSLNLASIQALLILAILYWGEGSWTMYSNVIAMCKRMSHQLGLGKLTVTSTSNISRIHREEHLRTYWMVEMLDSTFALGTANNPFTVCTPFAANLPCSDTAWALQDPFREDVPFHNANHSSGFSLCISLCTVELEPVHRFLQTPRKSGVTGDLEWQSAAQRLDEKLTIWREEFVAAVFRLINAEYPQSARAEMEPSIVLANCVLNMAVITLLQSQTSLPPGVEADLEPWPYANHRCIYACENMAAKIRRMEEGDLLTCSPCLILPIFVAARFCIVHTKCLKADVSVNLHSLAYSLHICSHRWPLAKMCESVIRTAVAEHRTPVSQSALPLEFYDLRCPVVDICASLQVWADGVGG